MTAGRRLEGKVAVVTGAGSGIGRATAWRFAAEGAQVLVNDRDGTTAAETADAVGRAGGSASAHVGDVTDPAYVDALVAAAVERHGRLDVMHNNAGYGLPDTIVDVSDETFDEVLRVNLYGVLYGMRAALRVMKEQRAGAIVNTASNAGFAAAAGRSSYGAAKAAVINLTRSAAVEGGPFGVRANAICPGPIETPAFVRFAPDLEFYAAQIPMKRLGRPEDIASVAAFLASDDAAYVSGVAVPVDGAMMARLPQPYLTPDAITESGP
ncbi:MAG TPA: SDR family NAD(P)-dependent oxidoreductase [Acidimicrobiia bacterium]|nr:SDR family NAD(P)-dependent oxidoreductase [Acidimicrobiia bacterium]